MMSKVKIVAIAKDEGAYIAEWIFHHLYFGFDAIDVYVNRTTDNTCDILDAIAKKYPNVNYTYVNWIDMVDECVNIRMQHITYAQAFSAEQKNKVFSHILFIDIDEFWTPLNFKDSIHDCISLIPEHTCISFQWFNILGEKTEFVYLSQSVAGFYDPLVKSICSTNADIEKMQLHLPIFNQNEKFKGYFLSDGSRFVHSKNSHQVLDPSQTQTIRQYVILHRMFRSEIEYISLLHRGNPEKSNNIKLNRKLGFLKISEDQNIIEFDNKGYGKYVKSREDFFIKIQINNELTKAKDFVLKRAELTYESLPAELNSNHRKVTRILKGLKNTRIMAILDNTQQVRKNIENDKLEFSNIDINNFEKPEHIIAEISSIFESCGDKEVANKIREKQKLICLNIKNFKEPADILRDIALIFERNNDIDQACKVMQEAYLLRTDGPKIQNKLKQYKEIIQKRKKNA